MCHQAKEKKNGVSQPHNFKGMAMKRFTAIPKSTVKKQVNNILGLKLHSSTPKMEVSQ
jgi:hypothetical protein